MIKKYSQKALDKRKQERQCLPEFFQRHIEIAKTKCCTNCGELLIGDVSEIAHRLSKSYFKSIQCYDSNVIYLCSWKSKNNCHSLYDGSNEQLQSLKIFEKEKNIIKDLLLNTTEKPTYKIYERWKIE